jgi:hypothetical protein
MKRQRWLLSVLFAAPVLFLGACRKSPEASPAAAAQASATTPADSSPKQRQHRFFTGGISPLIVSMAPDTIHFHDGHLPVTQYSLTYEINGAERATKAYITINSSAVGELQRFDVDVQPRGQIEFMLDASNFDLGPSVRFKVHCPYGDTDWFIMGSDPMNYLQAQSTRQISGVNPAYVRAQAGPLGAGLPITIASGLIMKSCTAEAEVDSSHVDLQNIVAGDKRITAQLPYDALQGRPVTLRHLEVNLVVEQPGRMRAADVYNLNYEE